MWLIQVLDAMMQNGGPLPVAEKPVERRWEAHRSLAPFPFQLCMCLEM